MFNQKENISVILKTLVEQKKQDTVPIWFMRQAGRYLPEYQEVMKDKNDFLEVCYSPELVEELTLQPINRFNLDAAIIFSDIMVIPDALGFKVEFIRGVGPKISNCEIKDARTVDFLEKLNPVFESIKRVRNVLPRSKSLIGFAGAPWTTATYILGKSKKITDLIVSHRSGKRNVSELIQLITEFTITYLDKQIESGADILQIFDSNASGLPVDMFREFIIAPTKKIVSELKKKHPLVPIIGFPKGAGSLYIEYSMATSVDATSADYSVPIEWISNNICGVVQGNLDPYLLAYDIDSALKDASVIMRSCANKPFIFNLGHGVLPITPVENVANLVDFVRNFENLC
ncbi:MAG: uroporphyrinogen decarboxylase [Aaplasma endosymbiont of Hyalomma asiaticum]